MTQIEVIQAVFQAQNKAKLESLTQEQKDVFITEKLDKASNEVISFVAQMYAIYGGKWEHIKNELSLGVDIPDNLTVDNFIALIRPLLESVFKSVDALKEHNKEDEDFSFHQMQPQPIRVKPFSRS